MTDEPETPPEDTDAPGSDADEPNIGIMFSAGSAASPEQTVADRTGELVSEVFRLAENRSKASFSHVYDAVSDAHAPVIFKSDGSMAKLEPDFFSEERGRPHRRAGTAYVTRLDSLIDHANRFKSEHSVLFALEYGPSLTAILNYHELGHDGCAAFRDHRAHFAFPLSDEWQAWTKNNGKAMSHSDFASFIEDRFVDVEDISTLDTLGDGVRELLKGRGLDAIATKRKLLEMAEGLTIHENSVVSEARNISSGEGQILFASEHTDGKGGKVNVPSLFIINVPVFDRGHAYRIAVRLRYRKTASDLLFFYELWREKDAFDDAFTEACVEASTKTGLPLFYGTPE